MVVAAVEAPPELEGEELEEAAAEFAHAFGESGSGEIEMAARIVLGWQCSYRRASPELKEFSSWRARWSRHRAKFSAARIALQQPRVRRPIAEALEIQDGWRKRRKVRP